MLPKPVKMNKFLSGFCYELHKFLGHCDLEVEQFEDNYFRIRWSLGNYNGIFFILESINPGHIKEAARHHGRYIISETDRQYKHDTQRRETGSNQSQVSGL